MEERYEEEHEKQIGVCQSIQQHEDAALKTSMQFFADELLPYLKIPGKVVGFAPTHLVPLTLCPLMVGDMPQKERIRAAYRFTRKALLVQAEDIRKIEAVIYAMADKFLESMELEEIVEDISMTRLGQMLVDRGIRTGIEQGIEQGIQVLIQTCQELCVSKEDTENRILQSFAISGEAAKEYLKKYWK